MPVTLMMGGLFGFWRISNGANGGLNLGPFCQIGLRSVAVEVWEEVAIEVNNQNEHDFT